MRWAVALASVRTDDYYVDCIADIVEADNTEEARDRAWDLVPPHWWEREWGGTVVEVKEIG